jgi:hypothetical protein
MRKLITATAALSLLAPGLAMGQSTTDSENFQVTLDVTETAGPPALVIAVENLDPMIEFGPAEIGGQANAARGWADSTFDNFCIVVTQPAYSGSTTLFLANAPIFMNAVQSDGANDFSLRTGTGVGDANRLRLSINYSDGVSAGIDLIAGVTHSTLASYGPCSINGESNRLTVGYQKDAGQQINAGTYTANIVLTVAPQ